VQPAFVAPCVVNRLPVHFAHPLFALLVSLLVSGMATWNVLGWIVARMVVSES
jgi:hypothetical protein